MKQQTNNIYTEKNHKEALNKQLPWADRALHPNLLKSFIIHYVLYLFDSLSWSQSLQQGPVCHNPAFEGEPSSTCYPSWVTMQLEVDDTHTLQNCSCSSPSETSQGPLSLCPASRSLVSCVLPRGAQVHMHRQQCKQYTRAQWEVVWPILWPTSTQTAFMCLWTAQSPVFSFVSIWPGLKFDA